MKKGLRNPEDLCIHDGGDEGDRTPDLLTASQALSQLSYAPVTKRHYRGMFSLMQGGILIGCLTYGFQGRVFIAIFGGYEKYCLGLLVFRLKKVSYRFVKPMVGFKAK